MTLPATIERGVPRAMVPFAMEFACGRCGRPETGAPAALMPAAALPAGHVAFTDLPATGKVVRTIRGDLEYRYWPVTIAVMGVAITDRIKVYDGALPDFPVLGMRDLFGAFRVAFDFGAIPPTWSLEPYADRVGRDLSPLRLEDLNVMDYGDQAYRLSADLRRFGMATPALPAAAERLQIESRQARRRRCRSAR